jgi:hypothetical protein
VDDAVVMDPNRMRKKVAVGYEDDVDDDEEIQVELDENNEWTLE